MRQAVIVGGGISGLSTAYYLARAGVASTLVEQRSRLGGVIETERLHGCLIETGPDSFLAQKPWALELIRELGLESEIIGSNDHLRVTYVLRKGRLTPLPDGLMLMIPTRIWPVITTDLLSWPTKMRMALEWFRRPRNGGPGDRSVAEFVADHYGAEAVEYLAEPLLAGIYGGDPRELSVSSVLPRFVELERKYGSLTRGMLAARRKAAHQEAALPLFQTLRGGLGQLVEALRVAAGGRLEVLRGSAEALQQQPGGYGVRVAGQWIETAHVVLACPAYQAAALVSSIDAELAGLLNSVPYSSSITISFGYRRSELNHPLNGFGFLVPKRERRTLVACTWLGTKFSHRVPDHMAVLRCFVTGEDYSEEAVRRDLREIMGVTARPVFVREARWPRSMAQYTVGHAERVAAIEARLARCRGLHLAGNAYYGIGIPDCIRMGRQAAERISRDVAQGSCSAAADQRR